MEAASSSLPIEEPEPGAILALDYGRKRVGVAVSDALQIIVRPLEVVERRNRATLFRKLRLIAREHNARQIIVGHPLNLNGSVSEMATEAKTFSTRLQKELSLPVKLVDERLTSWAAQSMGAVKPHDIQSRTRKAKKPRHRNDAVAAAILLQDYLESMRSSRASYPVEGK